MKKALLLLFASLVFQGAAAQPFPDTLARIEAVFANYTAQTPGCQLTVARHGKVLVSRAWGRANLEHGIPLTTSSVIEAGSVSKQFTAAAILLLEQQGRLSLEDDVRKYIPELPAYGGQPMRLRHLLHHTSGLKDWGAVASLAGWGRGSMFYGNNEALEFITHQKTLNNQPGDEFIYSNSNYNLFAIIVERVSGQSLADFTRQHIFGPAGMSHTQWRDNPHRLVPNRAIAYSKGKEGYETTMPNESAYGNGGLLTTTEDLLKWQQFYLSGKLGTAPLLARQTQTEPLTNGAPNSYAAGLFVEKVSGQDNISHDGITAGYQASLEIFPQSGLAIALLSNTSQYSISGVAAAVRNIFVPTPPPAAAKTTTPFKLSEASLTAYAGWYRNSRDGAGLQLVLKDGELLSNGKYKLLPETATRFGLGRGFLEMQGAKGLRIITAAQDTISFSKAAPAQASAQFGAYVGRYFSEETNSFLHIFQKDGKLFLSLKPHQETELMPTYQDGFANASGFATLTFAKQRKNGMSLKVSVPRARNVEFIKVAEPKQPPAGKGLAVAGS
ncbi:hypothetical protein AUC43_09110 [Hymenobacter sedentarius]|uniref:Beta-lactamase-related domain-containing protein n=1 Tax=Hymenobacter sedentarius TaxID=1411621 RepID=A0A0U4C4T0_9BACT|nr:serine hydrolase domain-containing protein [Hymenobacter sedentarius]ALW85240.1 hypothetical protein AUC43_09110 [Hymenobacter sedentarius]